MISEKEAEALKIAILLHDIGHGPFSHALENSIVTGLSHENLSLFFMKKLNKEFNGKLALAIEIFNNTHPKKFLHQLVSSQLDMDRLDYLKRDSFFSGVAEGNIGTERIINMLDVVNDELVVEEKGIYSIEKFLIARRLMYWQVYFHKTVVSAENMLIKVLQRAKFLISNNVTIFTTPSLEVFLKNNFTAKDFEKDAGYLRMRDAKHPLDSSAVHPESYDIVESMAKDLGCKVQDLIAKDELRKQIDLKKYVTTAVGLPTLTDIVQELAKPGRDPRDVFEAVQFADGVNSIDDLKVGMKLSGIVTNVTNFGAFVDIGVHQDGLVHISQLSDTFVSDPSKVVKVQQKVEVTVTEVDAARKRIALSMKTGQGNTPATKPTGKPITAKANDIKPKTTSKPAEEPMNDLQAKLMALQGKFK